MTRRQRAQEVRRGLAAVELALLLPFILGMLLGIWEIGRLCDVTQIMNNAAREGARQASTGLKTNRQVTAAVQYFLYQAMKGQGYSDSYAQQLSNNAIITVQDLTQPGTDVSNAAQLDQLQVTVNIPFDQLNWVGIDLTTNANTKVTGQAIMYSVKDQQFPTAVSPPAGY